MIKRGTYVIIILGVILSVLLIIPLISAGFSDWFKAIITGKAQSQTTNISISVAGANAAQIIFVESIDNTAANESGIRPITFNITMSDPDGVLDLNDTSVNASFSMVGYTTRFNSTCTWIMDVSTTAANYTCEIEMYYWDANGDWTINVSGTDLGNTTFVYNDTTNFQYNELKAMVIHPPNLTWPGVSIGAQNQTSDNDPTTINNTGNYNGEVKVTAINLRGETNSTEFIPAANFSIGTTTGGTNPECNVTLLVNNSAQTITDSNASRGNLSLGGEVGQERLYYCITEVPSSGISSQTYSTTSAGSWTIAY